ncbi:MAG: hypothetical protein IT376_10295 [Polyangiaceae bacterium]|nr:hypothetical protein [Polyangiaceae bacterium]
MVARGLEIAETPIGGKLREFLDAVDVVYREDPRWIRPLDLDVAGRLTPKNPFFEHGEATTFVARRAGRAVGRCSAQIDRSHLERYRDDTGFFGFLDTVDDPEVAEALLEAAQEWLRRRGLRRVRGPLSLNINEEVGCLVDGFDTPPMLMMPHHRPYQGGLIERAGFAKVKDLYAWRYEVGDVNRRAQRGYDEIAALPEVRVRAIDPKRMADDVSTVMSVFNDAWSDNWGFVPLSRSELAKMAKDLELLLIPELGCIAEIEGEPAAVALALPNVNEMIGDLNGKLLPFGVAKLLWRLKVRGPSSARLLILGIRKRWRHVRKYAALSAYLYVRMNEAAARAGIRWGELSWTLEDNAPVNVGIKMMGGTIYKTYRIYERAL